MLQLFIPDRQGLIFNFQFGKTLRSSSLAVVVKRAKNSGLCPVRAIQEFSAITKLTGWALGVGYMFSSINNDDGLRGQQQMTAAAVTASLQSNLRDAGFEAERKSTFAFF